MHRAAFASWVLIVGALTAACGATTNPSGTDAATPEDRDGAMPPGGQDIAFFFQTVETMHNEVRVGLTTDGVTVESFEGALLEWNGMDLSTGYRDPVVSRLSSGAWIVTARSSRDDPRGGMGLLVHQAACPHVVDADAMVLMPSREAGCLPRERLIDAKTSQVFDVEGSAYLFLMNQGDVFLARLSDGERGPLALSSICLRADPPATVAELGWGDAVRILDDGQSDGLFTSDTAIARRTDGTWVLFVKGIEEGLGPDCIGGSLCEICARSIYRTTSPDLLTWTPLERLVGEASIPEATQRADGSVWLYWQDFTRACAADDRTLTARAAISGARELPDGSLSERVTVAFPREPFESDEALHYATNGNPVFLPDETAAEALRACQGP